MLEINYLVPKFDIGEGRETENRRDIEGDKKKLNKSMLPGVIEWQADYQLTKIPFSCRHEEPLSRF
jgi:hypothetical protein